MIGGLNNFNYGMNPVVSHIVGKVKDSLKCIKQAAVPKNGYFLAPSGFRPTRRQLRTTKMSYGPHFPLPTVGEKSRASPAVSYRLSPKGRISPTPLAPGRKFSITQSSVPVVPEVEL